MYLKTILTAGAILLAGTSSAHAIEPEEIAKLLASDGATGDLFGYSVAVDGDTAIIGAWGDSDLGNYVGSAYVFAWDGTNWVEQAKLTASDGAASDYFGDAVAVDGDTAFIGAWADDDLGSNAGSVYVFSLAVEPVELLASLATTVDGLDAKVGTRVSLQAKLDVAIRVLNDSSASNDIAALNALEAFINAVGGQVGKSLTFEQADDLIVAAQQIIDLLAG
jgi:hypothetical protein